LHTISLFLQNVSLQLGIEPRWHGVAVFLLSVIIFALCLHLYNFQRSLTYGYQISELSSQRLKINGLKQKNNIELSRLQSLDYIQNSGVIDFMRNPKITNYVRHSSATALRY
jgi:hypothetical protein